jgi:hypothetical protein
MMGLKIPTQYFFKLKTNQMTNDLTMPTIISVKQFDTAISVKIDKSDTDVREMLELFEKVLLAHGYQQESINDTIFEMANKVKENAKRLATIWEKDFPTDDSINRIIKKYS